MAQVQAVEKDLVTMAQESEKLRAEIEKRRAPSMSQFPWLAKSVAVYPYNMY
jgi:hypothetical protein